MKIGLKIKLLKIPSNGRSFDDEGKFGLINLLKQRSFVLDGQHRVLGARGVNELKDNGLQLRNQFGRPLSGDNNFIKRIDFLSQNNLDAGAISRVLDEEIAVEYIPAVIKGETRIEATQRIRDIFTSINTYAKNTTSSENALLDENDGFAIVARHVGAAHELFSGGKTVEWKGTGLPSRSKNITTLTAIRNMIEGWTKETNTQMFDEWTPETRDDVPERPNEAEISKLTKEMSEVFDYVSKIPIFKSILNAGDQVKLEPLREFPDETDSEKHAYKGHILLRPHGQEILIGAVGRLTSMGHSLEKIFEKLNTLDRRGGFEAHLKTNVWFRITYDPDKKKMITNKRELGIKLLTYLVSGLDVEEQKKLLFEVKEVRKNFDDQHKGEWYNFEGKSVKAEDHNSDLPNVIR